MKKIKHFIIISFILAVVLSAITFVPVANSEPIMEKVTTIEKARTVFAKLFDLKYEKQSIFGLLEESKGVIWDLIVAIIEGIMAFYQLFYGVIFFIIDMIYALYSLLEGAAILLLAIILPIAIIYGIISVIIGLLSGNQNSNIAI